MGMGLGDLMCSFLQLSQTQTIAVLIFYYSGAFNCEPLRLDHLLLNRLRRVSLASFMRCV